MATIAVCGLGMMGSQMAGRLRSAGHTLRVWNRSPQKASEWAAGGGSALKTPAEAAQGASEAHLMLSDDESVKTTLFGPDGLVKGLAPRSVVIDHTTVSVNGAKERAERLKSRGFSFLQCPVFGSPPQIGEGKGLLLIGGEPATYAAHKAVLEQIVGQHFIAGTAPEAAAFKLMGNCMLMFAVEGLAEFLTIGKASGIDPQRALALFSSFNPCGTIERRGPRMATGDYRSMFSLSMAKKDVGLMVEAVHDVAPIPGLEMLSSKMKRLMESGYADLDLSALGIEAIPPRSH
jgi:3-hydroxyisobutyrate dehydrogenase-like beta-hydroxyacid dehydrogenase